MLTVKIPSNETYRIGTRPAVLASVDKMLDYFDINVNQKVFFNGEAEVSKMLGGNGTDKRGADTGTDLGYDNKLFVELERDVAEYNDGLDGNTNNDTVPCVWYEPSTGSKIIPKFTTRRYNVIVNAYFKDRVTAQRYLANIRSKALSPHMNSEFSAETHFPMTYPQLQCFKEIFDRLMAAGLIAGDVNFIDWMISNSVVPAGILRNVVFNNPVFVFKQCIDEIGVNVNVPQMAYVNQGSFIGKYEVAFTYWFYWSEHTDWIFRYPIQVYQQPMPSEYIPDVFEDNKQDYAKRRFFEAAASHLVWDYKNYKEPFYHCLPSQDNWRPEPTYWVSPQLQVLVNVENVAGQSLLNITDISGFDWDPTFIKYIMKYKDKITNRHRNPMNFKVYSNDIEVLEAQLSIDNAGNLILDRAPRMENNYRVVFSLDYALRLYNEDCVNDLLDDPEYGRWILGILFPHYVLPENWGNGGWWDWEQVHNGIEIGDGDPIGFYMPYGMLGSLIIGHNAETYQQYKSLKEKGVIDGTNYYRGN